MMLGAKVYSTDVDKLDLVNNLWCNELIDYLEIKIKPNTLENLVSFSNLGIDKIFHAATADDGFNLSNAPLMKNMLYLDEFVFPWVDECDTYDIIVHAGIGGTIKQACEQIRHMRDPGRSYNPIIENSPPRDNNRLECVGVLPKEMPLLFKPSSAFCLDVGHAIAAANYHGKFHDEYLRSFLEFDPEYIHLHDGYYVEARDRHLNIGQGDYPIDEIVKMLPEDAWITVETPLCKEDFEKVREYWECR